MLVVLFSKASYFELVFIKTLALRSNTCKATTPDQVRDQKNNNLGMRRLSSK